MLNNNSLFKIFSIKKKSQSWRTTSSLVICYYQYQKIKFIVFTLKHYNLFVLFIIVIFYICFNLGDSYVECTKQTEILKVLQKSSEMGCPNTFIKTLANHSFDIRKMPYNDIKPLLGKNSAFHS